MYCIKPVWEKKTAKGQKCSESIKKKKKSRLFSELKNRVIWLEVQEVAFGL